MPVVQENLVEKNNLEDPDHMTHLDPDMVEEFKKTAVEGIAEDEEELVDEVIEQKPERVKLDNNEIFKTKKLNKNVEAPVVEKVKKPKRQITEEHRERLRKGREKALANRRAKAKAKKEKKEDGDTLAQEQSDKDFDESFNQKNLDNIVEKKEIKPKEIIKEKIIEKGLSKEEIIEITTNVSRKVLEENESKRKERKAKKLKIKEEEAKNNNINNLIRKATTRGVDPNNPFHMCY